jgi:hypothetical protein
MAKSKSIPARDAKRLAAMRVRCRQLARPRRFTAALYLKSLQELTELAQAVVKMAARREQAHV